MHCDLQWQYATNHFKMNSVTLRFAQIIWKSATKNVDIKSSLIQNLAAQCVIMSSLFRKIDADYSTAWSMR